MMTSYRRIAAKIAIRQIWLGVLAASRRKSLWMTEIKEAAANYVWPTTLLLPPRRVKLVYLDLNHWVALAKAFTAHRDGGQYKETLAACIEAVDRGAAVFPISDSIYFEVSKIKQHRQRRDLREVIERVSRFTVVTARSVITVHEIESLLDRVVGPNPQPINGMNYIDWGVARAFGVVGGFRVKSHDGTDVTDEVRLRHPPGPEAFDQTLSKAELEFNRQPLEGPTAEEEPQLRELGWKPESSIETSRRRALQEVEQVDRLNDDPVWRRGRLRDVVAAREVLIEINSPLARGLSERSVTLEDFLSSVKDAPRAFDSMPSFDVAVSLKTSYHRDSSHRWKQNDIHDIDALGSTLPYCDIVVTDKAAASHAKRTGLSERLKTTVLPRVTELGAHL
jgi:hypothetical protein